MKTKKDLEEDFEEIIGKGAGWDAKTTVAALIIVSIVTVCTIVAITVFIATK